MNKKSGFTIVELLVVIVVIGTLAAITIVSYTGISQKAVISSLQSDLSNSSKKLKLHIIDKTIYPSTIDCSVVDSSTSICLRPSGANGYLYMSDNNTNPATFYLEARNGGSCYSITENSTISSSCITVVIGNQVWMKNNLNIGVMTIPPNQTNNGIIEKYCYNNIESNCTTYGGIYRWSEAMQYTSSEGARGICPSGFHIPSNNDFKILEVALGMTQAQADITGTFRGTDQGTKMKIGGSSGFEAPLPGIHSGSGAGSYILSGLIENYWTSTPGFSGDAAIRRLTNTDANIMHTFSLTGGASPLSYSIRCLKN